MTPTLVHTVSQINAYIKTLFTDDDLLSDVWLSGEISNFKQAVSGHCYFTLKDAGGCLRAVMWRTQAQGIRLPHDGDAVLAHGYVSVYEQRGDYQLYVDRLEPGGIGWLWQEFQRLKERLDGEGLFDPARKRRLHALPCRLGVATSASAAALRDVLRTLATRYPMVEVVLAPTRVQGDEAPAGIVAALALLNRWSVDHEPLDAIILARGGGSIEELWAFNDERVGRAIAASLVPVITGIGHETDFTIADFVADVRAPTPTGAAMAAAPDVRDLAAQVAGLLARAQSQVARDMAEARDQFTYQRARLARLSPQMRLARERQGVDDLNRRATLVIDNRLRTWRDRLHGQRLFLSSLDPSAVLARGYAVVSTPQGTIVSSQAQVGPGDRLRVRVTDGSFDAEVKG
jgi:exodeoxyribonuclease VII large subunit